MSVSLDNFIEGPGGDLSWSNPDEELHKHFNHQERMIDIHFYGRRLYENMATYWPMVDENPSAPKVDIEYAQIWKNMPKIVFSKTLDHIGWNSKLIRGNIATEVNRLKKKPGKDMSVAGAEIASSFMQLGLIDEYRLYVHPVVLGSGKPMFRPLRDKINLHLVETHTFGSGVVLLRYQIADARQ
jgi:dihydrofolate reductase